MTKVLNLLIVFIMIMVMACAHALASEEGSQITAVPPEQQTTARPVSQPSVGAQIGDALLRIPMLAVSSVSTAVFVAISPVVTIMGIGEPMARAMVEAPWRFTAARPLGDFTGRTKDGRPIYIEAAW